VEKKKRNADQSAKKKHLLLSLYNILKADPSLGKRGALRNKKQNKKGPPLTTKEKRRASIRRINSLSESKKRNSRVGGVLPEGGISWKGIGMVLVGLRRRKTPWLGDLGGKRNDGAFKN